MFKKKENIFPYDPEKHTPTILASICNGEKQIGFTEKDTGKFLGLALVRNENDIKKFCDTYNIKEEEISKKW
ncbi:MAG: aspartate dehydrogenase [Firmicutes bacterium]|nr:aspartate dehydrogenase [Bacillota bacterium]